ncbi:MAG: hypothetical protein ABIP74_00990 [Candidatus Saccharimonas sp.]
MLDERTLSMIGRNIDKQTETIKVGIMLDPPDLANITHIIVDGEALTVRFILKNTPSYHGSDSDCKVENGEDGITVTAVLRFPVNTKTLRYLKITRIEKGGEFSFTGEDHYDYPGCGDNCNLHRKSATDTYEITVYKDSTAKIALIDEKRSR